MDEDRRLLSEVLAELASMAADPIDVVELMQLASDRACRALSCDAALILLTLDGESLAPAGSSRGMQNVDELLGLEATPCHESMMTGECIVYADDDVPERFADFAAFAGILGVRGALSVPMRHRDDVIGTLCLVRTQRRHFLSHTIEDARRLADVIAAGIIREQQHRAALAVTAQLEHALQSRIIVEQAKGMVAAELQVGIDDALDLLRRFARSRQQRLADIADDVVNRRLAASSLLGEPSRNIGS